jgi:hypothetical protein
LPATARSGSYVVCAEKEMPMPRARSLVVSLLIVAALSGCGTERADGAAQVGESASADHAWGGYHWARQANPFTVKLGDNVTTAWDGYLVTASSDWSGSSVLDTTVVGGGTSPRTCKRTTGQVEVCNARYGFNGWRGVATIWLSGDHITAGTVKLNDSYFGTATYNTPAWRQMVMCQEIGHTFGLDHQDENFGNGNLGSCMDYTSDPSTNQHPNAHDFEQLESIYAHLDATTTVGQAVATGRLPPQANDAADEADPPAWGRLIHRSADGRLEVYEQELGGGQKTRTYVIRA